MHLFASLILPATILAAPLSLAAQREGEMAGLIPRSRITCKIVNDNGEGGWGVKCRDRPDFSSNIVYDGLDNGESYTFSCYKRGDCYNGNCTWDYAVYLGCWVHGYYTDNHCTVAALGTSCS
ncbi:hypothetical protein B0O99DRAFT_40079 [Bisporella sp. PMI_857]|nr:hypothetical protein B0O99DRAFT_40079 [Bisporella sp. PMI_857]